MSLRRTMSVFFFNDTATTEIYTLSLHDALPIYPALADSVVMNVQHDARGVVLALLEKPHDDMHHELHRGVIVIEKDRKSTRLNSSHANISYAVFCLKKKIIILLKIIHTPQCSSY